MPRAKPHSGQHERCQNYGVADESEPSSQDGFLRLQCMHDLSPSGQARAYGLFESSARCVGVQQNVGIARLNVDVPALLGNNVEQGNATIPIRLVNDVQILGRLVADAAAVNGDPCLRSVVTNEILCDLVLEDEVDCGDPAPCSLDSCCVRG